MFGKDYTLTTYVVSISINLYQHCMMYAEHSSRQMGILKFYTPLQATLLAASFLDFSGVCLESVWCTRFQVNLQTWQLWN